MSTPTDLAEQSPAPGDAPAGRKTPAIKMGQAISVVFFVSVGVRVLSLVSQSLIAAVFGTGKEMDAYVLALIAPSTLAGILTTAVGAAIIPVFIEYREKHSEQEAMHVLWAALTLGTLLTLVLTGIIIAGAPLLILLLGHAIDPQTRDLATILLRFLMPIVLLQGLVTAFGAILNAYGRFASSALLPGSIAVCTIGFLVFAHAWGIYALAWGTLVGYVVNLLLLCLDYLRLGLRFRPLLDWRHSGVRRIAELSTPAMIGVLLLNINILVDQSMAALLPAGNLSAMNFAVKLVDIPSQFFYLALSSALLPVFSMHVARGELAQLRATFKQITIYTGIVLLPAGALLGVLARLVVQLLFERGHFGAFSTNLVTAAVIFLAPSIFLVTCGYINGRMYNALQENKILRNVSLASVFFNAVLDYVLMQFWGIAGITFSTTLTNLISTVVIWVILRRKLPGIELGHMGWSLGKAAFAAGVMWLGCALLQQVPFFARLPVLVEIAAIALIGLLIYLVVLWGVRVPEVADLWSLVRSRLPLKRSEASA
jgi:putative peptidoglycan lipid II flippase